MSKSDFQFKVTKFCKADEKLSALFNCEHTDLNLYLSRYALSNIKKRVNVAYVVKTENEPVKILGYYTLSAGSLAYDKLPLGLQKGLPKYPFPVARIGKLAVDVTFRRQGMGAFLLCDALQRCKKISEEMGLGAVIVDSKAEAKAFYEGYGFSVLKDLLFYMKTEDIPG